ncbi:UDP-glucuronic acid decarboxylase 1 [Neocloeon triangulifer]|uniref:UDP-glucuronic acid decarboxylase 1 n=1 Tax=Neocloeon triangulifer TaxID=2078957 RepID=UPI00286F92FE|nr:UDP-glucuronic acid decarboxylase 1 [Neocloeon triangulifer]XP_059479537.1 UDP-glucuronic acid decarboxylase 1 [Neocloeon triangulifer]
MSQSFIKRKMRRIMAASACAFGVLIFYINWVNSHVAVDIHDGAEDALSQNKLILKQNRHGPTFQEALEDHVGNEITFKTPAKGKTSGHENDIRDIEEAKLKISELQAKLMELEKRLPKQFPEVDFRPLDRKRILITGGAGFVGSHLVDKLMLAGHEVTVVDNFFTGRKRNVEHWLGHENFELIHHDIVRPLYIEVDQIYHLASPASPPHYMFNPVKTIKTNTLGTINVLGLAKRVGARVLIASTSEVYGDPEEHPQSETYWGHVNPIGPRACYDEGKRVAETLSYAYMRQENVSVRVARIFNTYGPRMHMNDGRVVSNFILQALKNETMTVYGAGSQTRSFQYVSDLVDGLIALMNSNMSKPVNLGNPIERTIKDFAVIIKDLVGGTSEIKSVAAVEDDPQRRRPDISRAKQYLNWEPKVLLEVGLKKTVDYFKKELKRSRHSERNFFKPDVDVPDA